jgi:hypothetical protein
MRSTETQRLAEERARNLRRIYAYRRRLALRKARMLRAVRDELAEAIADPITRRLAIERAARVIDGGGSAHTAYRLARSEGETAT